MLESERILTDLVVRARAGDAEAVRTIVEKWGPVLRTVIRRRLAKQTRSSRDSRDFTQDVWKSFFAHILDERTDLTDEQMLRFVGVVARNKVVEANRQCLGRAKAGPRRVESLDGPVAEALVSRDPPPEQALREKEEWERILRVTPGYAVPILKLLRNGSTIEEIAAGAGVSERSAQRYVERAHRKCGYTLEAD